MSMSPSPINDAAEPFSNLAGRLDARLLRGLDAMGYTHMTPVQQLVLTTLPTFQSDCLVQAKTGTGKTSAFLLPSLHSLLHNARPLPQGRVGILIISPTRELALQIAKECDQLTSQLSRPLECHVAFGGTSKASNLNKFMNGSPSILVATPGRLKDYLSEPPVVDRFRSIRTLILDEADTMLASGFLSDIKDVLKMLPPKSAGWQGMCFSATFPHTTLEVVNCVLKPGHCKLSTIDKTEPPTIDKVPQSYILMPSGTTTFTTLCSLLKHEATTASKIIVFGVTANIVALLSALFTQGSLTDLPVFELHSRLSQNVRIRTTNLFKESSTGILFASDVVGRGMDFPAVDLVVQVGLPTSADQYVHRVGRTGRAGNDGRAIILLTMAESYFLTVNRHLPVRAHASSANILAGAVACTPMVERAMYGIDEVVKQRAYSSYLGFFAGSGLLKPLKLDKVGLVKMANEFAVQGMCCPEPPFIDKKIVGKMGLKGIQGFNYSPANGEPAQKQGGHASRTQKQQKHTPRPATSDHNNGKLNSRPGHTGAVSKPETKARNKRGRGRGGKNGGGNNNAGNDNGMVDVLMTG